MRPLLVVGILTSLTLTVTRADAGCPTAVTDGAKKALPGAALLRCEPDGGHFEATLQRADKTLVELELSANGEVLAIEEAVPIASLPSPVLKAVRARYPKSTLHKAERITKGKDVSFEVEVKLATGVKEATFKADGTFVEEE
ncbi:MAG: hypothetical protein SFX73_03375 [Kofleriaceae bacterium]|nr:hypothetical protein [Kofleriaceae bacterium]